MFVLNVMALFSVSFGVSVRVAWGKMDTGGKMTTPPFYGF